MKNNNQEVTTFLHTRRTRLNQLITFAQMIAITAISVFTMMAMALL